jgi:uncharacterized Tic20 family protein
MGLTDEHSAASHDQGSDSARLVAFMIYGALFGLLLGVGAPLLTYMLGWEIETHRFTGRRFIDFTIEVFIKVFMGAFFVSISYYIAHQYELRKSESRRN